MTAGVLLVMVNDFNPWPRRLFSVPAPREVHDDTTTARELDKDVVVVGPARENARRGA